MNKEKYKILCIAGTRPEFIKMYPVYKQFCEQSINNRSGKQLEVKWILSSQHKELLEDLEKFFNLKADFEFDLEYFKTSSDDKAYLPELSAHIISNAGELYKNEKPDLVVVQGDTMTAQQCALAAFYQKIPVAHVEAGIRTNDIKAPFPEELARRVITQLSDLNFAPSPRAHNTLEAEKIMYKKKSYNFHTGNTVVDALDYACNKIADEKFAWGDFRNADLAFEDGSLDLLKHLSANPQKKIVLLTAHRRESGYRSQSNLANAIYKLADRFKENDSIEFIFSLHKSPEARKAFEELHEKAKKDGLENIKFLEAINYPLFVRLMQSSYFIVTDSGGIQEEAPYLSKPVLIFRNETERTEGIDFGLSKLIGTDEPLVHGSILEMLLDDKVYKSMIKDGLQPYGDGLAASRIVDVSLLYLKDLD